MGYNLIKELRVSFHTVRALATLSFVKGVEVRNEE